MNETNPADLCICEHQRSQHEVNQANPTEGWCNGQVLTPVNGTNIGWHAGCLCRVFQMALIQPFLVKP